MTKGDPPSDNWVEPNRCPTCGRDMTREQSVGERLGLYFRCPDHGRFRYNWDHDRLDRVGEGE